MSRARGNIFMDDTFVKTGFCMCLKKLICLRLKSRMASQNKKMM